MWIVRNYDIFLVSGWNINVNKIWGNYKNKKQVKDQIKSLPEICTKKAFL